LGTKFTSRSNDENKGFSLVGSVLVRSRARLLKFLGVGKEGRQGRNQESSSLTGTYLAVNIAFHV